MTHDPNNPGIPTTNTVNSIGHPYLSTSANPKQFGNQTGLFQVLPVLTTTVVLQGFGIDISFFFPSE